MPARTNVEKSEGAADAGRSIGAPAGLRVVTGTEQYTMDCLPDGLLHMSVLRSPVPHARIVSIDTAAAERIPGVRLVLTHRDSPPVAFSTARHDSRVDDPDDTHVLDDTVRFVGQRVAAVVADSLAVAESACRAIQVEYARAACRLRSRCRAVAWRSAGPRRQGCRTRASATQAATSSPSYTEASAISRRGSRRRERSGGAVVRGRWTTQRVQHAHLETHGCTGWRDEQGRLVIRTSSQVPFLVRDELCHVFGLDREQVHVFTRRVGGGFGGKQEMLTEDLVALAVLRLGRPVRYDFTRSDEFVAAPCRHPFRVDATVAAGADGVLTAMAVDVLMDAGAYGNHSPGVMFHGCGESVSVYRCPNKRVDAQAVYTNNIPSGAFRGYGLGQVMFADRIGDGRVGARNSASTRSTYAAATSSCPATRSPTPRRCADDDLTFGSYGLDQCLDLAERALATGNGVAPPDGPQWRVGEGMAVAMIATIPPRGHFADASVSLDADGGYTLSVGTAEFGNGTTTVHTQLVASELNVTADRVRLRQSDTDACEYDTGAFGSAGTVVAGLAVQTACRDLQTKIAAGGSAPLVGHGRHDGTPRSVAFNVHAFRVAVNVETGEVRILQSVQAADAGVVMNPEQCRGQVEGGVAQAIGSALYEEMRVGADGAVTTTDLRNYHIPQLADVPLTEVYFADTYDALGPLGAKSMSESPYNPVAPALANAIARACGARMRQLPMTPARVWRALQA